MLRYGLERPVIIRIEIIWRELGLGFPYNVVGGETALFGGYTAHLCAAGTVGTYGHTNDNAASSTTVGATVPL